MRSCELNLLIQIAKNQGMLLKVAHNHTRINGEITESHLVDCIKETKKLIKEADNA